MTSIHPTAVIEDGAAIDDEVAIGPYCVVGSEVELGVGVELKSHVTVTGHTRVGSNTHIFPYASVGHQPQDLKFGGEKSSLEIGANCVIREHATLNPGTKGGGMVTRVGNNCLVMIGAHVAHDCQIGNHVILVNNATLGGHVSISDYAIIGGMSGVHQFVRIGAHAMIGGMSGVENDVIPYGSVMGNRAYLSGLNIVGLKRRGFARSQIQHLRNAYRLLFAEEGTLQERIDDVAELFAEDEAVMAIVSFMRADSSRSVCQPKADRAA